MNLEQQIAFSSALIDAGVPEREADAITDRIMVDPWEDVAVSVMASISCWHAKPGIVLGCAWIAAHEAE